MSREPRPAGWCVVSMTRGFLDGCWWSDREIALAALNWYGRNVYPGEPLALHPIRRWHVQRPDWLDQ